MAAHAKEQIRAGSSPIRLGMKLFLVSEGFLFGALFWTYYYLRALTPGWPTQEASIVLPGINTALLLASSATLWFGIRSIRKGNGGKLTTALLVTALLGAAFFVVTMWEWVHEGFRPWTDAYGSVFYTITGFHALHVLGGVVLMLALFSRSLKHLFTADDFEAVDVGSIYWHFVDAVWIAVFTTIFIIR